MFDVDICCIEISENIFFANVIFILDRHADFDCNILCLLYVDVFYLNDTYYK